MRICVAQTRPVKGDVAKNMDRHLELIECADLLSADIIIFPELSLTGYEPELADKLAMDPDDLRLNQFQDCSDEKKMIIGVGLPTKAPTGTFISTILFHPGTAKQLYSKKYLHHDELPFFIPGENPEGSLIRGTGISLAICYELSVDKHIESAVDAGANCYLTSVAKTAAGVEQAASTLSAIANKYSMITLMSNCVGPCDNFVSGGKTSIWNDKGILVAQLDDQVEGILLIDTVSLELITQTI